MLTLYRLDKGTLTRREAGADCLADDLWIDMVAPTKEEEAAVEAALGVEIPTREEMREIETSSQVYKSGDALVMTVRVLTRQTPLGPALADATFILRPGHLVTVRYLDSTPFRTFAGRVDQGTDVPTDPEAILLGILTAIVGRVADVLEEVKDGLDTLSRSVFSQGEDQSPSIIDADLQNALKRIGRSGDLASRVRESLHSLARTVSFLKAAEKATPIAPETKLILNTLNGDIQSLLDYNLYLAQTTQFLLDSTLGLINIQQNAIIKIFSVAAVIFLPPTLIASIYGMNFKHMPELDLVFGYPGALCLMVISAILPYWYFRRRGWL
ncbi:magnesium transporter CorA family protein [Nitrospirillum sp. BR 11828]|uniref:magnesium transporter CorA family protein n=1 Tax=Nitrospirillum sp. BR 11828 TaxID=3104325 RepID=UPI002ACAFF53|nr:magnesium transporter CorA family protein [Nitrospirillum sp. BR 11828]MDZ5645641.1 magnesium transporter CorA family protein [Nitrospirillum sp. BR 11828]